MFYSYWTAFSNTTTYISPKCTRPIHVVTLFNLDSTTSLNSRLHLHKYNLQQKEIRPFTHWTFKLTHKMFWIYTQMVWYIICKEESLQQYFINSEQSLINFQAWFNSKSISTDVKTLKLSSQPRERHWPRLTNI